VPQGQNGRERKTEGCGGTDHTSYESHSSAVAAAIENTNEIRAQPVRRINAQIPHNIHNTLHRERTHTKQVQPLTCHPHGPLGLLRYHEVGSHAGEAVQVAVDAQAHHHGRVAEALVQTLVACNYTHSEEGGKLRNASLQHVTSAISSLPTAIQDYKRHTANNRHCASSYKSSSSTHPNQSPGRPTAPGGVHPRGRRYPLSGGFAPPGREACRRSGDRTAAVGR
jgi:hypothetical protein